MHTGTGVGVGLELERCPFAVDAVVAEGADIDIVGGVGSEAGKGGGVVGKKQLIAAAGGETGGAIKQFVANDSAGGAPVEHGLVYVGGGGESRNGGAGVGLGDYGGVVPQHEVVNTEVGALLHGGTGGREEDDDEGVGSLLGERGVERVEGEVIDGEGGVVGDVGKREVGTAAHHVTLLGSGVVVGAEHKHGAVVARGGGVVFIAASEP